jgi:hypothetical protein
MRPNRASPKYHYPTTADKSSQLCLFPVSGDNPLPSLQVLQLVTLRVCDFGWDDDTYDDGERVVNEFV